MENRAPWDAEDAFPLKPEGQEFGYKKRGKLIPCSKETLVAWFTLWRIRRPRLVWTPQAPRLTTPAETQLLWPQVRAISSGRFKALQLICIFNTLAFGVIMATAHRVPRFREYTGVWGWAELAWGACLPLVWAYWRILKLREAQAGDTTFVGRHSRFLAWLGGRRPNGAMVIVGLLIVAGLIQLLMGSDRAMGAAASDRSMVEVGEYWRIFTGSFLHLDLGHFLGNLLWIAWLAWMIEVLVGGVYLPVLFLASCALGGLSNVLFSPDGTGVGASDVLWGMTGFLLVQSFRRRTQFPKAMCWLMAYLLVDMVIAEFREWGQVGHEAHAGGFLAGLVLGTTVPVPGGPVMRSISAACRACMVVLVVGIGAISALGWKGAGTLYEQGWEADDEGNHHEAVQLYSDAIKLNPRFASPYFGRASALWSLHDLEGARRDYDALIALQPDDEEAWLWRGVVRGEMNDFEGGLRDLDQSLDLDAGNEHVHLERGRIRLAQANYSEAMIEAERALSLAPRCRDALVLRGRIKAAQGDLDAAITDYSEVIRRRVNTESAKIARGDARRLKGDEDGALEDYESALDHPYLEEEHESLLGRGLIRIQKGDAKGAKADIERAIGLTHRWWRRRAEAEKALKDLEVK